MSLDTTQQMLIEQRIANDAKSPMTAYLLAIFLGGLGAHRFYLGRSGSGAAMLVMFIVGWLTVLLGVGLILLAALGIWCLIDLLLIPGMITESRERMRAHLRTEMQMMTGALPLAALTRPLPQAQAQPMLD